MRSFGPQQAHAHGPEILRSGLGALAGLGLAAAALALVPQSGLIAPFGASAVLVFAAPASPLAQPWNLVVGNLTSALVALAVVTTVPPGLWLAPLAVGLAIMVMMALRALHPPGGAVALLVALTAPGPAFALLPVLAGSALLAAAGVLWGHLTRRPYPHPADIALRPAAPLPLGLPTQTLIEILETQEQTANLGAADLARLIEAAEEAAATDHLGPATCADAMIPAAVVLRPGSTFQNIAEAFGATGFSALPVADGPRFLGIVSQIDLIRAAASAATTTAATLMHAPALTPAPDTPLAQLVGPIVHQAAPALPVLRDGELVGMVTRRALVSALVRLHGRRETA